MRFTEEQLKNHPKHDSLVGVNKNKQQQAREKAPIVYEKASALVSESDIIFVVHGEVRGKPTMTYIDRWKKRPPVMRYREFCDRLREAAPGKLQKVDVWGLDLNAFIAMPSSWSDKKKKANNGQACRVKPDCDNIIKAVADALFKQDQRICDERCRKQWCEEGTERIIIRAMFFQESGSS